MSEPTTQGLYSLVIRSSAVNVFSGLLLKLLVFSQVALYARLFAPEEIGQLATAMLIVSFVIILARMGLNESLIRDQHSDQSLLDTAFTLSLLVGFGLWLSVFLSAPLFAVLFERPQLTDQLRVLSLLVFGTTLGLPNQIWIKNFRFGIAKVASFFDLLCSTGVTLGMYVYADTGVWSLFWGRLAGFTSNYFTVWILAPRRPRIRFNWAQSTALYQFGWPLILSGVFGYIIHQGDDLAVRFYWGEASLAYYSLAYTLPFYFMEFTDLLISSLLPVYSRIQDHREKIIEVFHKTNRLIMFAMVPIGILLIVLADPLVLVLFGDKWTASIFPLKLFGLAFTIQLLGGYNLGILWLAWGKTQYVMYMKLWIVLYLLTVGIYLIRNYGLEGGGYYLVSQAILTVGVVRASLLYRELGNFEFLTASWKPLVASIIPGLVIGIFFFPIPPSIFAMSGMVIGYITMYGLLVVLLERKIVVEILEMIRVFIPRRQFGKL